MWPTTIVKCKPGETRGHLHGYEITQVWPDHRDVYAVNASTGIEAMRRVRSIAALRTVHSFAKVVA